MTGGAPFNIEIHQKINSSTNKSLENPEEVLKPDQTLRPGFILSATRLRKRFEENTPGKRTCTEF